MKLIWGYVLGARAKNARASRRTAERLSKRRRPAEDRPLARQTKSEIYLTTEEILARRERNLRRDVRIEIRLSLLPQEPDHEQECWFFENEGDEIVDDGDDNIALAEQDDFNGEGDDTSAAEPVDDWDRERTRGFPGIEEELPSDQYAYL